ncbi:PEP-CTERM sorting domain-containing protein [Limnoraphis robusta]|uniref:PEP-CTERM sorting domain-containing protein n=1 Tax=Limnoraphis robusta CCNP1315 TaxID=3110306 RepID=A0ABU5U7R2_9CYAN|nr:PEP-CTERM sorting domain-containing protein [Limnoraphis robusta]MEA5522906.1 PEP-CTERM sorting domain-containing protein [Limnoraphis robusta CCNP1315]MEA5546832.1 PEP-CTERM sorting domain-containing protein [Limnoraphis robusta CCNP1324]
MLGKTLLGEKYMAIKNLRVSLSALVGAVVAGIGISGAAQAAVFTGSLGVGEIATFKFEATGLFDILELSTDGSNFDTELGLYDASGNLIDDDDDGGTDLQSFIRVDDSPSLDGVLTAVLGGFDTIFGPTLADVTPGFSAGDFTLSIDTLALLQTIVITGPFASGSLEQFPIRPVDDLVRLTVDTQGSNFDTELGLYDADGNLVDDDDDGGLNLLSFLEVRPDQGNFDGDLTVVLGAFDTIFGPTVDDVETFSDSSGNFQVNINQFASTGGVKSVPEPATILGLLAVGGLGLTTKRKQKST